MLDLLAGLIWLIVGSVLTTRICLWVEDKWTSRKLRASCTPDPLDELAEAHNMEVGAWDADFKQLTGKNIGSRGDELYAYEPSLGPIKGTMAELAPLMNAARRNALGDYLQSNSLMAARQMLSAQQANQQLGGLVGGLNSDLLKQLFGGRG